MRKRFANFLRRRSTKGIAGLSVLAVAILLLAGGGVYAALGGFSQTSTSSNIDLQKGLVGWWKMDGNAKDATPYGDDGTVNGASLTTDRENITSSAYAFNGSGNYINVPNATQIQNFTSGFTVSCWFKGTVSTTGIGGIIAKDIGGTGATNPPYAFWVSNGKLAFFTDNSSDDNISIQSGMLSDNTWYHAVGTWDGSTIRLYINGTLVASAAQAAISPSTGSLKVGQQKNGSNRWFTGSVDDVRVYNRALSGAEAQAMYNEYDAQVNAASGESGLVGWWKMNGNAKDATPYSDNATAINSPTPAVDREGAANGAYSFNGTNQYIQIPAKTQLIVGQPGLTVSAWINPATLSGTTAILSRNGPYLLWVDGANKRLYTGLLVGSTWYWAYSSANSLVAGQWQHIAMTFDGTSRKLYVNGVQSGPTDAQVSGNIATNNGTLYIGEDASSGGRFYFNGSIADVRIYNRALSAQEVTAQARSYNSQINLDSSPTNQQTVNLNSGLAGYWPFNGNAKDTTPYQNNGTVNGATLIADRKSRSNSAYQLGDTNASINVGSPSTYGSLTTSGFTYSVWLMRTTTSVAQWPEIMGAGNTHIYYGIRSQSYGNSITFEYGNGTFDGSHFASLGFGSCATPTYGTWHLYTVTYSGTTLTDYCDGASVATSASAVLDPAFGGLSFTSASSGWNGAIDDARVYNRPLNASEVAALYASYY